MLCCHARPASAALAAALATALALAVAALALGAGCRARTAAPIPAPESEPGRFPHARHVQLACTECHARDAVLQGRTAMPGSDDHAPCDRSGCHREAFTAAPGALCAVCHAAVDPTRPGASPLRPYPPEGGRRALASSFSHQLHLDAARVEQHVGFHVTCTDCHEPDDRGAPRRPDHAVCGRCHAPEAAPAGAPPLDRCAFCHQPRPVDPARRRVLITGDLRFEHGNHLADRRGAPIRCVECHAHTPQVTTVVDHPPPATGACVTCHDDVERTPSDKRMRVCQTCHAGRRSEFHSLAPRSHLPRLERPEDHTLAFRRDHAGDARAAAARCARCHTFMSGSPRDVCDECHQVMRPHDHTITWREFDHGPAASARADTCATCHNAPYCITCHARVPRSHLPRAVFRTAHGVPARMNLRACLTCHDAERTCVGSGCHTVAGVGR